MSYKHDLGSTTHPALYVPFNECSVPIAGVRDIPCRVGMSRVLRGNGHSYVIEGGHITFPGDATGSSGCRAYFSDAYANPGESLHRLFIAPSENIGKTIVMSAKFKRGVHSGLKGLFSFSPSNAGGMSLDVSGTSHVLRLGVRPGISGGIVYYNSVFAGIPIGEEFTIVWTIRSSENQTVHDVYAVTAAHPLGAPVIHQEIAGLPSAITGPQVGFGDVGDYAFDIKDFLAVVVDDAEAEGVVEGIVDWYKNPNNQYELPDFLRQPQPALARQDAPRKPTTFLSTHTLRSAVETEGFSIGSMYSFVLRYVLKNSAFEGVNLTLGVNAFQPNAGEYLITELRNFADWLHTYGLKLGITLVDQSYLTPTEIPEHMPFWSTTWSTGQTQRKVIPYWNHKIREAGNDIDVDIEEFDVDAEILTNPKWPVYDSSKQSYGTYRWFHHCWHIVNAIKDKPAFAVINTGETSGSAWGDNESNIPGSRNRCGIYGITKGDGTYRLEACFSSRRQRVALGKLMYMISDQLKFRPDVLKSVQTNYFRASVGVSVDMVLYYNASQTFTAVSSDLTPKATRFRTGDAAFLTSAASAGLNIGMKVDHLYYVTNASENTFKLSETPGGPPITLTGNITTASVWLAPIVNQIEIREEGIRVPSEHNGYQLAGYAREMRFLAEKLHQFGFAISGPDIFTKGLENPQPYYEGPVTDGKTGYSVIEARLAVVNGSGWYSDLGPLPAGATIQGQDSTYLNETNPILEQICELYGQKASGILSLEQAYRYAIDRLKCHHIDMYVVTGKTEEPLPNLVNAVAGYKLS